MGTTRKTAAAKPVVYTLGDVLEDVETVVRPDGSEITVTDGFYVLDATGDHVINGNAVTVK